MLVSGAGGGRRTRPERLLDQVNILAVTRITVIRILRLFLVDLRSHRDFPEPRSEQLFRAIVPPRLQQGDRRRCLQLRLNVD